MKRVCRLCKSEGRHQSHVFREMMFGSRKKFEYFECCDCGSLQIVDIPSDLSCHYPENYLGAPTESTTRSAMTVGGLRAFLRAQRSNHFLGQNNLLGWLVSKVGQDYFPYPWSWFQNAGVNVNSAILDVGCGPGSLLHALVEQGFTHAVGQDLFQRWSFPGVTLSNAPLDVLRGQYDLIMLHHSFEHMPDPAVALAKLKNLCALGGTILLRIPVAGCLAWKRYQADWYQIDAPRHLVIPSVMGLELLAQDAGLRIRQVEFDSTAYQFACSEQYRMDIPLKDPRSSFLRLASSGLFSDDEKSNFAELTRQANACCGGDQACFYLSHAEP